MKLAAAALVLVLIAPQDDPAKNLKSKDVSSRLTALQALAREKSAKNEKAVLSALKDDDWEVVEAAADVLGQIGSPSSADELVKLALSAPILKIRLAAAASLAKLDPVQGAEALIKKATTPDGAHALDALARLAGSTATELDLGALEKLPEKGKDEALRAAAARALVAGSPAKDTALFAKLLASAHPEVVCAALDAAADEPATERSEALANLLSKSGLIDVVERRAVRALAGALVVTTGAGEPAARAEALLAPLLAHKESAVARRAVRVVLDLARRTPAPVEAAATLAWLQKGLAHTGTDVRAEAAGALGALSGDAAWTAAKTACAGDKEARVRRAALQSLVRLVGATDANTRAVLVERLANDKEAEVRLAAAVALGQRNNAEAASALEQALGDGDWRVQVCAAVALGKLQTQGAVDKLAPMAKSAADWRLRAAAVEGLAQTFRKECVPPIIAVVADPDPTVQQTAYAFLCSISKQKFPPKPEPWNEWWKKEGAGLELVDPRKRPSTGPSLEGTQAPVVDFTVWRGLDVVALDVRPDGDHIEKVLERQKLEHRKTIPGKVGDSGLHPAAVFVANCTGAIEAGDVERIQWFVLAGGRLFGSCWAVTETIARCFPGVVQKTETTEQVLDTVPAFDCAPGSPYLRGVFFPGVVPMFVLEGAYLIDVIAPERCEVLVDSPECAAAWGSGTLAVLFQQGHGTILDSVNHFEAQGFENVTHLKTPEQRQAWAIDHMGYSFEELRKTAKEKWWDNALRASDKVEDLLVFRLVTNVVKEQRAR